MEPARKNLMEDKVLWNLIHCAKDLSGIDLKIKDHPDRANDSRNAISKGADAILSGLDHDVAVQIGEVPITQSAYSESARIKKLTELLEPLLAEDYPDQAVDVWIRSASLRRRFNPETMAQEIVHVVREAGVSSRQGLLRDFTLASGEEISVRRYFSSAPCPWVRCELVDSGGFLSAFERVLESKCCQFDLYKKDCLLCVVLWSGDFMHLNQEAVIQAFKACSLDLGHVDSIWFAHQSSVPLVYPIYSQDLDSRIDSNYLECYQWWPALGEKRPFESIPHQFGCRPIAQPSDV
jgi:hypothetical protein